MKIKNQSIDNDDDGDDTWNVFCFGNVLWIQKNYQSIKGILC